MHCACNNISLPVDDFTGFLNQNLRQIGQGVDELWSDIQTNKQREQYYI